MTRHPVSNNEVKRMSWEARLNIPRLLLFVNDKGKPDTRSNLRGNRSQGDCSYPCRPGALWRLRQYSILANYVQNTDAC